MCNISGSNHDTDQQCMDVVNTVQCWTEEHIRYAMPPLLMLPPYYAFAMHLKMTAQVHRSRTPTRPLFGGVRSPRRFELTHAHRRQNSPWY